MAVARWLVGRGARHLLLLGRSAIERDDPRLADLAASGAAVDYASIDVGDAAALERSMHDWRARGRPPIRGVVHAAGIFHDRLLEAITPEDVAAGLRAKIVGAHALDRMTGDAPLDFFLLFSSLSGLIPPAGQAVYASACAFLDALAQRRRAAGRTALSIDWGPWSEVGFAATQYGRRAHAQLEQGGMKRMTPDQGLEILDRLLGNDMPPCVGVLPVEPAVLARQDEALARLPILRELAGEAEQPSDSATSFLAGLKERDVAGQREVLVDALLRVIAQVLKHDPDRLDVDTPLTNLGFDSLIAVQFKNRVARDLGLEIPLVDALRGASASALAERLLTELRVDALRTAQPRRDHAQERAHASLREEFVL